MNNYLKKSFIGYNKYEYKNSWNTNNIPCYYAIQILK